MSKEAAAARVKNRINRELTRRGPLAGVFVAGLALIYLRTCHYERDMWVHMTGMAKEIDSPNLALFNDYLQEAKEDIQAWTELYDLLNKRYDTDDLVSQI